MAGPWQTIDRMGRAALQSLLLLAPRPETFPHELLTAALAVAVQSVRARGRVVACFFLRGFHTKILVTPLSVYTLSLLPHSL